MASNATAPPVSIEDLYKYFGILADAKTDAGQHEETYMAIVGGTKGGAKEKQLASQFITRFFKHFPKQMPLAIDAIFDLCEDDDVTIRKSAIKDLGVLCKDCSVEHLNRIADILTQLLQTDDQQEFSQVQTSLFIVFKQNPKSTLQEIFNQINTAELEEVRKRAIKFLVSKIPSLFDPNSAPGSNKELEELVVKYVKQVLLDVDSEEFILFIRLLTSLPSMNTLTGRQDLVNIIMSQSEIDKPFVASDLERLMILLSCIQQAIPLFSKNVQSTKYVHYLIANVLSVYKDVADENIKFEILRSLADMCTHYSGSSNHTQGIDVAANLSILYDALIEYLPKPAESQEQEAAAAEQDGEAKFNFSYVECLLLAFHTVAKYSQDFLIAEASRDKLKDFRLRLQYFAKGTQNYIKELRNLLNAKMAVADKENEENKIRRVALKVTTNIDLIIKDFFHNPPSFKTIITPSWKSNDIQKANENQQSANKRSLSVDNGNDEYAGAKKKPERGIYHPPSGKYSTTANVTDTSLNTNPKRRTFSHEAGNQQRRGGYILGYKNNGNRY